MIGKISSGNEPYTEPVEKMQLVVKGTRHLKNTSKIVIRKEIG